MARHGPQIATAVDLHTGSGLARFRAAARTVLADIQDRYYRYSWPFFKRHEATRRLFVAAYATKMRFDVANEYWGITLPGSKPAEETYAGLLREVSSAARSLWSALARLEYRKTVVHMASRCDHCEDVIVGPRYACLYCDDIDLCHSCAQLKLRPFRDRGRRLHHSWHPYMKIDRPIIKLSPHIRSQFKMIVDDLQSQESSSSTSSDELIAFDPTDDLDDYYTAGEAADRRSAYTLLSGDGQDVPVETLLARKRAQARYRFRCSSCAETKMGVRFILPNDDSVNYMCQLCERAQTVRPSNQPLPPHLRLTLRISLPLPDDDDISSIGSSEEDDDSQGWRVWSRSWTSSSHSCNLNN
ncbi:hypothetical protein DL93DRAFT_617133 [Clavulina sp. PMI_390]|nr:hypothetical protein DL93DRAFT_617133 [Clavulina sp. PMI_390]